MILKKIHFKEDLYESERIECTEKCAVLHRFLCIEEHREEDQGLRIKGKGHKSQLSEVR
jgi:hypothetical protein